MALQILIKKFFFLITINWLDQLEWLVMSKMCINDVFKHFTNRIEFWAYSVPDCPGIKIHEFFDSLDRYLILLSYWDQ